MREISLGKFRISKSNCGIVLSGFVLFLCALAFAPSSQIFRTIPFFVAGGVLCGALSQPLSVTAGFSAVMTLCIYLASGRSVKQAVLYSAVACILSVTGTYVFMFCKAAKKTGRKQLKSRYLLCAVVILAIAFLLSALFCGNAVSFVKSDAENSSYIKGGYGESVSKKYTSYEALEGQYRTYVSFSDKNGSYGDSDEYFVVKKGTSVHDGVRNHYESELLYVANARLASVISNATWGYNITTSDIPFEAGEFLHEASNIDDYMSRISYVVSLDSIFHEHERDMFSAVCEDVVSALSGEKYEFDRIILCGGTASEVLFCFEVTEEVVLGQEIAKVADFDEKMLEDMGVTEMTVLDYWNNK